LEIIFPPLALSKQKIENNEEEEGFKKEVSKILLHCNELDISSYTSLINSLPAYKAIKYEQLDGEKIEVLISKKIPTLTTANFDGLKSRENNDHIKLIEIHQDKFIEEFSELSLDADDWILVLQSPVITTANKLSAVKVMDDDLIINNTELTDLIFNILPENKYLPLSFKLLVAMFKTNTLLKKKISILNMHLDLANLNNNEIEVLVRELGENYKKMLTLKKKPTFPKSHHNISLFKDLENRNLISSFKEIKGGREIRVIANYL
jgi:hypothetical protein